MTAPTVTPARAAEPFALHQVRIKDGSVFVRAREGMLHLARVYPVERLLSVFRANAGLDTRGALAPGSWEDFGHPREQAWGEHDYPGREHAHTANLLRGHYAGHFLSMLALAWAGERDPLLRARVDDLVAGLAEVQQALAATGRYSHPGFLAAYGEWQFSRLEEYAPYGEIWAPYYTCHKLMAGLLDAHELAGNARALEVVTAMGHWVHARLSRLEPGRLQRMWSLYIAGEYGGMNETMARLGVAAGVPEFLDTARLFDLDRLIDAAAAGTDILTGMHANQHLPQLIGYVHEYEATGARRYLDAAIGVWDQIVPGRTFAHGGTGESELWGPPDTVAGHIGHRNAETCATYNLLKLARLLFLHTLDPRFTEYYERASLNHILGSRRAVDSGTSPEVTYMFPVHPGALREYGNVGTCCGGTGLESHVTHQDSVFFRGPGDEAQLWVNLLVPAELHWEERGLRVALDTEQPYGGRVRLRVDRTDRNAGPVELAVHVRIPGWVSGRPTAHIGDDPVDVDADPGTYATVRRAWTPGEVLELELPMRVRALATTDDARLLSLQVGPTVLAARSEATTTLALPIAGRRLLDGSVGTDGDADPGVQLRASGTVELCGTRFEPVWSGSNERYHLYVRSDDAEIAFAGERTGVPHRRRVDGGGLLDDLWAAPVPTTRQAFLDRVLATADRARAEGLLARSELERVLAGAACADLEHDGVHRTSVVTVRGAAVPLPARGPRGEYAWEGVDRADRPVGWFEVGGTVGDAPATATVWVLPPASDEAPVPPAVTITADRAPAASGWYTTPPLVRVEGNDLDAGTDAAGPVVHVRVGDGEWTGYRGPFLLAGEGTHRVSARVVNAAGRTGHAAREFHVDTAPPRSRARVMELGQSVEITLSAADDVSGVERIQWQGPGTFRATFQEAFVRALTDHEQVIEFAATDRAGNEEPRQRLVLPPLTGRRAPRS